jgi:hypothetical protein
MCDARSAFAAAVAIINALAASQEGFPRNASGIVDPRFFSLGVAAAGLSLLDDIAACLVKSAIDLVKLAFVLDLDAEMIESGHAAARRNRKIQAGIVEHPFGIVGLGNRWLCGEQFRIEADGALQIVDRDVNMHAFHECVSFT